jgi:hypothetical protein
MKKTPWFYGTVKPVHVGVYERLYPWGAQLCKWDGAYWYGFCNCQNDAAKQTELSEYQNLLWRGLVEKP